MRCSSKSLFFRRGGDGLKGLSRLVPSKDAGEAVPLIALVCSGTLFVRVLAVSLFLSLSLYLFSRSFSAVRIPFFDTTEPTPVLSAVAGEGSASASARCVSLSLCLCLYPFLRCLCVVPTKIKYFFCQFQIRESSLGRPLCRGNRRPPDFAPPGKLGIASQSREAVRPWYKHRVRRYFEEE